MESPSNNRGMPVTHVIAILVALVVLGLLGLKITSDKQEEEVVSEAHVAQPGSLPFGEDNAAKGFVGTMAMLNDYSIGETGLDQLVADRIYSPRLLHASRYSGPAQFNLASNFVMQLNGYNNSVEVQSFGEVAKTIATTEPGTNSQQVFEQFARIPGGQLILEARGNQQMVTEFTRLTMLRTEQLVTREMMLRVGNVYHNEWKLPPAPDGPVELPTAPAVFGVGGFRQILTQRLRQWELNGVRYFFCLAGSAKFGRQVQAMFPADTKPLYQHALNATIDPVKRRFHTVLTMSPINGQEMRADGSYNSILVPSTNGPISLVEFTGALPRVKLYADWIVDTNDTSAHQLLFSPGFDPQNTIVLSGAAAPPEQPARTRQLPAPVLSESGGAFTIKIPPTKFASVLLLNESFVPGRRARMNDAEVELIRANMAMTGLPLPASDQERTITVGGASGAGGLSLLPFAAIALIVVVVIVARRRRA